MTTGALTPRQLHETFFPYRHFLIFQDLLLQNPGLDRDSEKLYAATIFYFSQMYSRSEYPTLYQRLTGICTTKKIFLKKIGASPNFE
jgi:hypothetical protein